MSLFSILAYPYMQVMMMVAFSVELQLGRDITAVVTVVPLMGFNLFLLAILVNLVLGHVAINCHRIAAKDDTNESSNEINDSIGESIGEYHESLQNHVFSWPCVVKNHKDIKDENAGTLPGDASFSRGQFRLTTYGKSIITVLVVGCIFLVIAAVFLLTFVFHFKGLVGFLLGSEADTKYSVVSTGTTVPTASGNPNSFIVRWIQACFFGFGVAMPLLFLFCILIAWLIPLRLGSYRKLLVLTEVANAWNAIDVFVVSVVAALFEIQEFAAFIIGDVCDGINEILKKCCDEQLHGDDKCFDVTADLLPKFWVLGLTACVLFFFGLGLLMMGQQALRERETQRNSSRFRKESIQYEGTSERDKDNGLGLNEGDTEASGYTNTADKVCGYVVRFCCTINLLTDVHNETPDKFVGK